LARRTVIDATFTNSPARTGYLAASSMLWRGHINGNYVLIGGLCDLPAIRRPDRAEQRQVVRICLLCHVTPDRSTFDPFQQLVARLNWIDFRLPVQSAQTRDLSAETPCFATTRHMNTVYVIAVMTSLGCGADVLCYRAVEPDSTGQHAQTYSTLDACIAVRDQFIEKDQRDTGHQRTLRCVPENSAPPYVKQ